ncbi:MAG: hypothetical protein J6128_00135 [Clostridia bacterium]|nr:hypothetical protein [Clostridia bacterium]
MQDIFEKFEFSKRTGAIYEDVLKRVKPNRKREDTATGMPDDKKTPFEDAFEEYADESYIVCEAHAIVYSWLYSEPIFFDNDILVGFPRPFRNIVEHFSFGNCYMHRTDRIKAIYNRLIPMDDNVLDDEGVRRFGGDANAYGYVKGYAWSAGGYQGHTIPSYPKLLGMGVGGVLDQIESYDSKTDPADKKKKDFYKACRIIMEGFSAYITQYADKAAELASKAEDIEKREQLLTIEKTCRSISRGKPKTFLEAAQLMWFFCLWDWVDCIGRFDQYMLPFWTGSDEDKDVLTAIFMKFWEHGVHNMTISGVIPETGEDATNEITYHVLRVMRTLHETHPRMTVRVHEKTPRELMKLVVLMWSEGMSDPTLASDFNVVPSLMGYGVPERDARDYSILGCQEIEIPGKSNFGCEDGFVNLAKIFEYTLFNGRDRYADYKISIDTGNLKDYKTFDDLWNAFVKQIQYLIPIFIDLCNIGVDIRVANVSKLVKSTMTEACIERGLQHDEGGTIYNYGVIETGGHGAVGDSLYALKTLVYDTGKLTLEEVYNALDANFEGYEDIRQELLNAPKYGNDNREADEMSAKVLRMFWSEIRKFKSRRGDVFTGACSLLEGGTYYGKHTWALPDGRFTGSPLGNTIGPRTGSDKNGLTPMLNSVARMPLELGVGGSTSNVLIPTTLMENEEMREKIAATMMTFMKIGGQLAQITTATLEEMKDAQIHPDCHENLIVRVGGFSMKFIEFDKDAQDEFILRYSGMCNA